MVSGWQNFGLGRQRQLCAGVEHGPRHASAHHHLAPVRRQGRVLVPVAVQRARHGGRDRGPDRAGVEHEQHDGDVQLRHREPGVQHRLEHRVQGAGHRARVQPQPVDHLEVSEEHVGVADEGGGPDGPLQQSPAPHHVTRQLHRGQRGRGRNHQTLENLAANEREEKFNHQQKASSFNACSEHKMNFDGVLEETSI